MRSRLSFPLLVSLLAACLPALSQFIIITPAYAAAAPLVGRAVADVLAEARGDGIVIVFNTQVVPETLRVLSEPATRTGLPMLRAILAPHGLGLTQVAEGAYAVTAGASGPGGLAVSDGAGNGSAALSRALPLDEVVVTTSRFAIGPEPPGSHTVLSGEALNTLPRLGEETLKAVQRLPGVATNGFAGQAPVRGGEPDETLILLDGLVLYEPFHLKNFLSPVSLIDSRFISGLDFYSGGFGAKYGDRMSAVIDTHSLTGPQEHQLELGLSLFHVSALAAGELRDGRAHWLVSLRQSNLGRVFNLLDSDLGHPEYEDGFFSFDFSLTDSTRLDFNVLASRDEIDFKWERTGETANADYRNTYVWTTVGHDWTESLTSELIASYTIVQNNRQGQVEDPDIDAGEVQDRRSFDVAGLTLGFDWRAPWGLHQWGIEAKWLQSDYDYHSRVQFEPNLLFPDLGTDVTVRDFALAPDGQQTAAFWSSRVSLAERWIAEAGIRLEDQTYTGPEHAVQFSPRLSLLYQATEATRFRGSWGRYSQLQRINELQLEDGIDYFLPAQQATHLVLSVDHQLSPALALRIEAYRKDYSHLKARYENLFNSVLVLPEIQPDRVRVAPSSARMQGLELSLTWRSQGPWSGWFNYTWSQASDVVAGGQVLRSWDQKHALSGGLRWARGPWDITLAETWHSGWPTTSVSLQTSSSPGGDITAAVIAPRNGDNLGNFQSLDVRASRRFVLPRGELEAWIEVSNLTNHSNACCVDYQVVTDPGGATRLDEQTSSWLGAVPSIGVVWRY